MKGQINTDIAALIPAKLKVEYLTGDVAFQAQQVAGFTGIHPVILEMGKSLVDPVGKTARFKLADDNMKEAAEAIAQEFVKGLKKVAKAISKDPLQVKYGRDGDTLVFWYAKSWSRHSSKPAQAA